MSLAPYQMSFIFSGKPHVQKVTLYKVHTYQYINLVFFIVYFYSHICWYFIVRLTVYQRLRAILRSFGVNLDFSALSGLNVYVCWFMVPTLWSTWCIMAVIPLFYLNDSKKTRNRRRRRKNSFRMDTNGTVFLPQMEIRSISIRMGQTRQQSRKYNLRRRILDQKILSATGPLYC